jgi:hypothetical protein
MRPHSDQDGTASLRGTLVHLHCCQGRNPHWECLAHQASLLLLLLEVTLEAPCLLAAAAVVAAVVVWRPAVWRLLVC